jgi:CheY-like chemotaxis protein
MSRALRVLIVEDHIDTGNTLALVLRVWGHEVHLTRDGLAGLRAAQAMQPDAVLLDIGLPAMDGWTVAERLCRSMPKKPLLIAVTGYGKPEDRQRSRDAGIDHHLVKPVDPDRIHELLSGLA